MGKRGLAAWAASAVLACSAICMAQNATFTEGQAVEVNAGGTWYAGKVIQKRGDRYLVRYADSIQQQWIDPEFLRVRQPLPLLNVASQQLPDNTSLTPDVGDRVDAFIQGQWVGAKVLARENGRYELSVDGARAPRSVDEADVRPSGWRIDPVVGQRVQFSPGRAGNSGTIVAIEAGQIRIRPDGPANTGVFEQWVDPASIRPASATDIPPNVFGMGVFDRLAAPVVPPDPNQPFPGYCLSDTSFATDLSLKVQGQYTPDAYISPTTMAVSRPIPVKGAVGPPAPGSIVAARGSSLVAVLSRDANGSPETALIDRINLADRTSMPAVRLATPVDMVLADVTADGSRLLLQQGTYPLNQGSRIEVWDLTHSKPQRILAMFPYRTHAASTSIDFAAFVGNDRILTAGGFCELALWDIATGKAVYQAGSALHCIPGVSANGKYFAFPANAFSRAFVVEAATGNIVMELPRSLGAASQFAFSPSGRQLVAGTKDTVFAFDLTTGSLQREFTLPALPAPEGQVPFFHIASPGDGYAVIGTGFETKRLSLLIDLERQYPLWRIDYGLRLGSTAAIMPSGQFAFAADLGDKQPCSLMTTPLPHPAALKAAAALAPGELLLKPGDSLSLQVSLPGLPDATRDEIVKQITQQLKQNNIAIAENQPIQLILSIKLGKPQAKKYNTRTGPFAQPGPIQTVNIIPKICRIGIVADGKTAWETGDVYDGDPGSIMEVPQGKTAQQVVDEQTQVNPRFFLWARLPSTLVRPRKPPYLGISELTPKGLRDK